MDKNLIEKLAIGAIVAGTGLILHELSKAPKEAHDEIKKLTGDVPILEELVSHETEEKSDDSKQEESKEEEPKFMPDIDC